MPEQISGCGPTSPLPLSGPTSRVHRLGGEPTVMLVEDHEDTREFMRVLFEAAGFLVTDRQHGTGAIDASCASGPTPSC